MDFATVIWTALVLATLAAGQDAQTPAPFTLKLFPSGETHLLNVGREEMGFTCEVSKVTGTDDFPEITWYRNDSVVTDTAKSGKRVYVQDVGKDSKVLFIRNVQEGDNGKIKCVASHGTHELSRVATVETIVPLEVLSSEEQFGILGQDGALECKAKGNPPPKRDFFLPDGSDLKTTDKYIVDGDTVTIKELTIEDKATYSCSLFVTKTGRRKVLSINYDVVEVPTIELSPTIQPNNAKEGDDVTISCNAKGSPSPTYQFKRGDTIIAGSDMEHVDEVNGKLTLKSVTRNSEATYTCLASNKGGLAEKSTTLNVFIPPKITSVDGPSSAVSENEQIDITCNVEGDPAPSLTWEKVGQVPFTDDGEEGMTFKTEPSTEASDAEIKTVAKTMSFNSIQPSHAGTYMCKAISEAGTANQTYTLEVKYKPHFDNDFKQTVFYGWRGQRVNLTCMASANDLATFKWYIPSADQPDDISAAQLITNEEPYTLEELQRFPEFHLSSSSLMVHISGDDESLYRDYICEASNGQSTTRTVTLKQATAPGAPKLTLHETLSTSVTLKVSKPTNNGGKAITGYTYSYFEDSNQAGAVSGQIEEKDIQGDITELKISQLKPSTLYTIEIMAKNPVGQGNTDRISFTTKEVSKPAALRITSLQQGTEPQSYTVTWDKPEDGGSPITKFVVTYQKVSVNENGASPAQWEVVEQLDAVPHEVQLENKPDALQFKISGLDSNSYYDVRIRAVNAIGQSDPAMRLIKTSASARGLRDASPGQLACDLVVLVTTACLGALARW